MMDVDTACSGMTVHIFGVNIVLPFGLEDLILHLSLLVLIGSVFPMENIVCLARDKIFFCFLLLFFSNKIY